jgi:hypothetical protein
MIDVSDTVCVAMPDELRSVLLKVPKLAPVKVLVAAALAVNNGIPRGGRFQAGRSLIGRERFPRFCRLEFSPLKV